MKRSPLAVSIRLVQAGRIYFLGGGALVYALGVAVAWYETRQINRQALLPGLAIGLLIQLMTHYFNEFYDYEGDALIKHRTLFSGGSGALADGVLSPELLRAVAIACAVLAVALAAGLGLAGQAAPLALGLIALTLLGALAYSQPPIRLVARGVGELAAAFVICFLAPLTGYSLQTGHLSWLVVATCLPSVLMMFAMIQTIELPDFEADKATGKRNLVVRLGLAGSARVHALALLGAYVTAIASLNAGVPVPAAILPLFEAPAALSQMRIVRNVIAGETTALPLMTFMALALFVLFTALQIAGFLLATT